MKVRKLKIKSDLKKLCRQYLILTKPFNKLRPKEIDVLSLLVHTYLTVRNKFSTDAEAWSYTFSRESREAILQELDMADYSLNNLISALRKKKAIINNTVPPHFMPEFSRGETEFSMVFQFSLNGEQSTSK